MDGVRHGQNNEAVNCYTWINRTFSVPLFYYPRRCKLETGLYMGGNGLEPTRQHVDCRFFATSDIGKRKIEVQCFQGYYHVNPFQAHLPRATALDSSSLSLH